MKQALIKDNKYENLYLLPSAQTKQIIGVCIGIVIMLVVSLIDFEWILNFYWVIYIINIVLLLCVEFFGANYNGAQRWIDLKITTLQPSDLTKIFLILFFAKQTICQY